MKLKSIIIIILMLLFVFSAGCGTTKEDNGNQNPLSFPGNTLAAPVPGQYKPTAGCCAGKHAAGFI